MRWLFTNRHPLAEALQLVDEEVVSTPRHHQPAHYDWLEEAIDRLPEPAQPWWTPGAASTDPVTAALTAELEAGEPEEGTLLGYPLRNMLKSLNPDFLVLTPLLQPRLGFHKGTVVRWMNAGGWVFGIAHDPGTLSAAKRMRWRGCSIQPNNLHCYVTDHEETARDAARSGRTVFWQPGRSVDPILEAARLIMRRANYMAGSRAVPLGLP